MTTGPLPTLSKCKSGRTTPRAATVMVFGMVSSERHVMPPHIFEVGLKVNTKVYVDVLKSVVIPWCNQVADGRPWVWQQDSAPAHKSRLRDPVLRLCTLFSLAPFLPQPEVAGLPRLVNVENIFNMTSRNTKASLSTTIRRVFAELPLALVEKACFQFRIRIEAVIEAEGGYIE